MEFKLPIIHQLKKYNKETFTQDLIGGLTVGVMLIPQGMAYAYIAEIPPVYGLYASIVPLLIYMLIGTSKYAAIGPAALTSLLVITGLNQIGIKEEAEFLNAVFVIAILSGLVQLLMGVLQLGRIVNFISKPVLKGFIFGAALTIFLSQVRSATGIQSDGGSSFETLISIATNINTFNVYTLIIAGISITFLFYMKRFSKKIPNQLIIMLLTLLVVFLFNLEDYNVSVLGVIPEGLPSFFIPRMDMELVKLLLPISVTIGFISFVEVYAIGVSLEDKEDSGSLKPNQELIALGLSKVVGAFFQAYPTSTSFSRSAVNKQAGTKTNLAAIHTVILIVLTLVFLTPYFYYLPKAVLAAIIMVAIIGLMDFKYLKRLWSIDKRDFLMFLVTGLVTFLIGVQEGIITGIILSIMALVYAISYPHAVEIGWVKGTTDVFRNVDRHTNVEVDDQMLIFRFDAPLTFTNVPHFLKKLKSFEKHKKNLKYVIVNASSIDTIDTTAIDTLSELADEYKRRDVRFVITCLKGPVRDKFQKTNMFEEIGKENFFPTDIDAVQALKGKENTVDSSVLFQANSN